MISICFQSSLYVFIHSKTEFSHSCGIWTIFLLPWSRTARHHDLCLSPLVHLQLGFPHVLDISTRLPIMNGESWRSFTAFERALRSFCERELRGFTMAPPIL